MTAVGPSRVAATEYEPTTAVFAALQSAGLSVERATDEIARASARMARAVAGGGRAPPITVDPDTRSVTVSNVAGVIRIAPGVELDVAPKFLGHHHVGWREDLLAIASATGEGSLLTGESLSASYGRTADLASLIGRVFVEQYWLNRRYPLRTYRPRRWREWSLDGELDLTTLPLVIDEEGLPQRATVFDRTNPYTALIRRAAEVLAREVVDLGVRTQLHRTVRSMPRSGPVRLPLRPLPARHRRWGPLLQLSERVIEGFDVSLHPDRLWAPGFILRTWQAWEQLLFRSFRREVGYGSVSKRSYELGVRRLPTGDEDAVLVYPDVSIDVGGLAPILLDAKYKIASAAGGLRISGSDLQESMAFMAASEADAISLLYPREAHKSPAGDLGGCRLVDCVEFKNGLLVLAMDVEIRGLGKQGGLRAFQQRLVESEAAVRAGVGVAAAV